jgi:ribosome-associated heat shock protein Hsp15
MGLFSWPKGRRVYQYDERPVFLARPAATPHLHRLFDTEVMPQTPKMNPNAGRLPGARLDRWLVQTRFFKTRTLAARAVAGGHVKRGGERASPGDKVSVGDRLEIVRGQERFEVEVVNLPARRGPAAEARACYVETPDSIRKREEMAARLKQDRLAMPRTEGRPDKRTRRLLRERHRAGDQRR